MLYVLIPFVVYITLRGRLAQYAALALSTGAQA